MILSQNPAIAFVESDLPEMLHQKQQLVHRLIGNRSNLHFLEINATHHLNSRLLNSYFQPDKPVTLLCEGLLMYLTFIEKQQVCTNVREILQTFGGVWITSDFTTKAGVGQCDSALKYFGMGELLNKHRRVKGRSANHFFNTICDNGYRWLSLKGESSMSIHPNLALPI